MPTLKDLKGNPENPRVASPEKLAMLKKSLAEFGDLSGIVYNRTTKMLIGGHQRKEVFPKDSKVIIQKKYTRPTKTGTVAEGVVEAGGERYAYREVVWDEVKEKAANIAANKGAGSWELDKLGDWMKDLDGMGFDLDLTMWDADERLQFFADNNFKPGKEDEQGKLDEKKKVECPECGHEFTT